MSALVVKEPESTATHDQPPLERTRASFFRSVCMRAAYLSIDCYDLQYVSKGGSRGNARTIRERMGDREAHGEVSAGMPAPHHDIREAAPAEQDSHLHRQRPRGLQEDKEEHKVR